jgi:putative ABC transport system permease protein
MDWHAHIRAAFPAAVPDADVIDELAQHAAATYDAARADGFGEDEARRRVDDQVRLWVHDASMLRRPMHRTPVSPPAAAAPRIVGVVHDFRYAARLLRRQPGYSAVVIATMALGIAAVAILASLTYGVLLKPLPWASSPRLVRLYENRQGSTGRFRPMMTNGTYLVWRDAMKTLDAVAAWSGDRLTVTGSADPERLTVGEITPSLLPLLGASPLLGRGFLPGEEDEGRPAIAILSHGLWLRRFGGRPDVVGGTLHLDGRSYTIVGVMPASFAFPDHETQAWIPMAIRPVTSPSHPGTSSLSLFQAIGRLAPGATPAQAATEGTTRGRTLPNTSPVTMAVFGSNGPVEVTVVPLLDALTGDVKPAILLMLAAVGLLLVVATANVANLQLARAAVRRRELAIRSALGAGSGRLARQCLIENLLLGLLGGGAGLALAAVLHAALPSLLPADFPRLADVAFDARVQLFTMAVALVTGVGFGLLPAIQASRENLVPALTDDALAPVGASMRSHTSRTRATIMAMQVALATVLLVGAVLLIRSFIGLLGTDVGYDRLNVLTARLSLPDGVYTPERRIQTLDRIAQRLSRTPGVTHASFGTVLPFSGRMALSSFPLRRRDGSRVPVQTGVRSVSAGYFAALGQRVVEGREFTPADTKTSAPVIIVNREFARKYLDGRALGWVVPGNQADRQIVGVVDDAARRSVTDVPQPEIYMSLEQQPLDDSEIALVVRTTSNPQASVPAVRSIVHEADPAVPVESIRTLEDLISASLARPHLYAVLLGTFAALALAIAGVGLFGVLSYTVAQRSREIGVRAALGAQPRDIVGLVVWQSLRIAGTGLAAGLLCAFWLAGTLQKFLYGLTPHDAGTFGEVALLLVVVAAVASYIPARRAARVDPVRVLRG